MGLLLSSMQLWSVVSGTIVVEAAILSISLHIYDISFNLRTLYDIYDIMMYVMMSYMHIALKKISPIKNYNLPLTNILRTNVSSFSTKSCGG